MRGREALAGRFFPPPAAHRAARTVVPSMHHNWLSIAPAATNAACRRCRISASVPSAVHVSNIRQAVFHAPNSSGKSRHGDPVRSTHRMPSSTVRASRRGRPVAAGSGNTSAINSHSSSVSNKRAIGMPSMAGNRSSRQAFSMSHKLQIPVWGQSLVRLTRHKLWPSNSVSR